MKLLTVFLILLPLALSIPTPIPKKTPQLNLAFDLETIETIKYSTIKPLVEKYLKNYKVPMSLAHELPTEIYKVGLDVKNIVIENVDFDWKNTHFLVAGANNEPKIVLKSFACKVGLDMFAHGKFSKQLNVGSDDGGFLGKLRGLVNKGGELVNKATNFELGGRSYIDVVFDLDMTLGFDYDPSGRIYVFIKEKKINFQKTDAYQDSFVGRIQQKIDSLIRLQKNFLANIFFDKFIDLVNALLAKDTAVGYNYAHPLLKNINFHLEMAGLPKIVKVKTNGQEKPYQTFKVGIEVENKETHMIAPVSQATDMPDKIDGFQPIQFIFNENLISQLAWAAFQTDLINKDFSQATLPADAPIKLNTDAMKVLFPHIVEDFGANKGMYVHIQKGTSTPKVELRDGRLVVLISALANFYVDKNGSSYPGELKTCLDNKHCEEAISLNVTAMATATVFTHSPTKAGVSVMNLVVTNLEARGNIDKEKLRGTFNNLLTNAVHEINSKVKGGIPLDGAEFGLFDTALEVGANHFTIGANFKHNEKI